MHEYYGEKYDWKMNIHILFLNDMLNKPKILLFFNVWRYKGHPFNHWKRK